MRPDEEEAFRKALIGQLSPEEQMWLQPQPEDVTDITTLVRLPFVAPLWEDAIPLAIPTAVDPAVTAVSEVPMSKGGPTKRTAGAGGESGVALSTASTMGMVMTTATTTTATTGHDGSCSEATLAGSAIQTSWPGIVDCWCGWCRRA